MIRLTPAPTPQSAEILQFPSPQAEIGVKAVSYYVTSTLDSLDVNGNNNGFHGIYTSVETSANRLDQTASFVYQYQTLARKLRDAVEKPDEPVEVELKELTFLGFSLFSLGNQAYTGALAAIKTGSVGFRKAEAALAAQQRITRDADGAYELFKEL